jgi:Mn2+/Fe2+ NRAMP family transporter
MLNTSGNVVKRLQQGLAVFLPGIFLLGFNIGTGSVTAMAKAGADYGMTLLWTLVASCFCTFFMINLYGRYTLVTGETALQAFKKHIHPGVGIFFLIALGVGVCGSVMGVMGIVADICHQWSLSWLDGGIHPVWFALFFISLVYVIFWRGNTHFFERFLALVVALMSACFLLNFFLFMPQPSVLVAGLIPSLRDEVVGSGESPLLVAASMVGTTVFSGLFIIRTTLVKEAGWTIGQYKEQRNDALFSVVLMFVISASIMAAAAGTLHIAGLQMTSAAQMLGLLEPLAGQFAVSVFAAGLIAAGVSSQFPNVLMLPWLICDYCGRKRDMTLPRYRIIVFIISLLGLVVPVFNAKPIVVMILSQAFNAVILPLTVGCLIYLSNKRSLVKSYRISGVQNVVLVAILLFSLFTAYIGLSGVWQTITSL